MSSTPASLPLVSIITPTYNQGHYIEQTILSVLEQDYPRIEYIVVDGGSTDQTLDILKRYEGRLKWISERDRGQGDAINKGFRMATGEIFGWVNSDDFYLPGTIRTVVEFFQKHPDIAFLYGDAIALDENDNEYGVRTHVHQTDHHELVNVCDFIVQPASFWRAELWHTTGELDLSLRYSLDYEYWMRASKRYKFHYLSIPFAKERLYAGAKTFSGAVERLEEIEQVARQHGGAGMPRNYRAEAAANYLARALRRLFKGDFRGTAADISSAVRLRPSPLRALGYWGVITLMGGQGLPWMWLRLNRIRSGQAHRARYTTSKG